MNVLLLALLGTTCLNLKADIESGSGTITLPPGHCQYYDGSINVPDGVTLIGDGSVIEADFTGYSTWPAVFQLNGAENVTLRGFTLLLGERARGIRSDTWSDGVTVEGLTIEGNWQEVGTSHMAVRLWNSTGARVVGNTIRNTVGGVYINGGSTGAVIVGNTFDSVHFNNVFVQGGGILIADNTMQSPGILSPMSTSTGGDGIGVSDNSADVRIVGNRIFDGRCYGIQVYGGSTGILISGNTIAYDATSAVYVKSDADVVGNLLYRNTGWGVLQSPGVTATIVGNVFIGNGVFGGTPPGNVEAE